VVAEGQAGLAIGKGGVNIKKLEEKLNKRIEVIEFSADPVKFLTNVFRPIRLNNAYVSEKSDGKKILHVSIIKDNLGMVKAKTRHARELIEKYFKFDEVIFQ
jgi:N utilization substance protein A